MPLLNPAVEERLAKTLVGRDSEIERFRLEFDSVLEGGMGLTVVYGQPGIGKTFFIDRAASLSTGIDATYVRGKFRQYDNNTLIGFSEVIEQLVRFLLTLPSEALGRVKDDLVKKAGADPAVIVSLCPFAQVLLGKQNTITTDSMTQLKYRVRKAVCRFFDIASSALYPLTVFLDDIQWADDLSLDVVETLLREYRHATLHLVLACRDDDAGKGRLAAIRKTKGGTFLRLKSLVADDVEAYVRLILGSTIRNKNYLVRMLFGLSLGNPFNIERIFRLFLREDVLTYSAQDESWNLSLSAMERLNLPSDIEDLLQKQIDGLSEEDRALLNITACYGDITAARLQSLISLRVAGQSASSPTEPGEPQFENPVDSRFINSPYDDIQNRLDRLCRLSMLVATFGDDPSEEATYGFVHDIVLRLVYNSMEAAERRDIHYRIAAALVERNDRTFSASERLTIASHLLGAEREALKRNKARKWVGELYEAGVLAKRTATVEQALAIFECCEDLLSDISPEERYSFEVNVGLELAECQFICGKVAEAKSRLQALIAKYPRKDNQIEIKRKYVNLCACNGDFEQVMQLGFEVLEHLNFRLNPKRLLADLLKCRLLFTSGAIARLNDAPAITDKRLLYILEILTTMGPIANRLNDTMSSTIAVKLAALSIRHGSSEYAPAAYAAYCHILLNVMKDPKKGRQLEQQTLALLERCEAPAPKSAAYCILGSLVHHWTNPLQETLGYLAKAIDEWEKEGSSLYGSSAMMFAIITQYVSGMPLHEVMKFIEQCKKKQGRPEHYLTRRFCDMYAGHIERLIHGVTPAKATQPKTSRLRGSQPYGVGFGVIGDDEASTDAVFICDDSSNATAGLFEDTMRLNSNIIELQRFYLEGRVDATYQLARKIEPQVSLHAGFLQNVEFSFHSALSAIAVHSGFTGEEQRKCRAFIERHLGHLQKWVETYRDNHYAKYLLVKAGYNALFGRGEGAMDLYREAVDFAEAQHNLPLEALGNLLAAKHCQGSPKLSRFYAKEAVGLYRKWGAGHIADLVAASIDLVYTAEAAASSSETSAVGPNSGDKAGVVEKAQADRDMLSHLFKIGEMAEDDGYLYLLNMLAEHRGVDYCAVFFERSDEMYLKYDKRRNGEAIAHKGVVNLNHLGGLPHRIIRYVARTETEVVIDPNSPCGIFANDPYVAERDSVSLACLPLEQRGVLAGIVYLEKANGDGFQGDDLAYVRGLMPLLLSKRQGAAADAPRILVPEAGSPVFTAREIDVLRLVAQGMSNSEISKELYITLGTVRNHLSSVYGKLGVENRVKAVMRARELKIVEM